MVTIQQLQYMVTLSEEGSFNKASEKCFVTQPTLSMQIKKSGGVSWLPCFRSYPTTNTFNSFW